FSSHRKTVDARVDGESVSQFLLKGKESIFGFLGRNPPTTKMPSTTKRRQRHGWPARETSAPSQSHSRCRGRNVAGMALKVAVADGESRRFTFSQRRSRARDPWPQPEPPRSRPAPPESSLGRLDRQRVVPTGECSGPNALTAPPARSRRAAAPCAW